MPERYWWVRPDGGRHLIDPSRVDLDQLTEQARRTGARLIVEGRADAEATFPGVESDRSPAVDHGAGTLRRYEPPVSAVAPLFRSRLDRIHDCRMRYQLEINTRPTIRVLGGYYRSRRLVRLYSHDRETGRRPLEELFDTFLHEMAHHLEYTEPQSFNARACGRVRGRMHSDLFWRILGELKDRWALIQVHASDDVF